MDVDLGQLREPCACGMEHNIDVEKIVIESGAVSQLEELLEEKTGIDFFPNLNDNLENALEATYSTKAWPGLE